MGVGCVMGVAAGWVGSAVMDLLYGSRGKKAKKVKRSTEKEKMRGKERSLKSTRVAATMATSYEPVDSQPVKYLTHNIKTPRASRGGQYLALSQSRDQPLAATATPLAVISPNVGSSGVRSSGQRKTIKLDKRKVLEKLASNYIDKGKSVEHVENADAFEKAGKGTSVVLRNDAAGTSGREAFASATRRRQHRLKGDSEIVR